MNSIKKIFRHSFFIKLLHWEYWPFTVVYSTIYIFWLLLSIRNKGFFFFSAANPSIKNTGIGKTTDSSGILY